MVAGDETFLCHSVVQNQFAHYTVGAQSCHSQVLRFIGERVAAAVHTKGQAAVRYFPVVSADGS